MSRDDALPVPGAWRVVDTGPRWIEAPCPVPGCPWTIRGEHAGELMALSVSEDDIRRHLDRHTTNDWLRCGRGGQDGPMTRAAP